MHDKIHISVKDTGIGVPPEHLANLFTPLYRVTNPVRGNLARGSGIV